MKLDEYAEVLIPQVVAKNQTLLACLSEQGRLLIFDLQEVRQLPGGGKGVCLMDLNQAEKLLVAKPISTDGVLVVGTGRGGKDREYAVKKAILEYHKGHRARKGKQLDIRWKALDLKELASKADQPKETDEKSSDLSALESGETLNLI